jgi:superfamily II DNA/RNA helicase
MQLGQKFMQKIKSLFKAKITVIISIIKDIVSPTGSGKTLTYLIPIIDHLKK